MRWRRFDSACTALAAGLAFAAVVCAAPPSPDPLSDAPDPHCTRAGGDMADVVYAELPQRWQRAEDINAWIGARFEYDRDRALALSESARARQSGRVAIIEPEAFYAAPRGVCVDLTRFAVSTLRRIDAGAQASYLMIEFEPVQVQGQWLRRHWMAAFRRDEAWWFFADSKRPGHLAGPYDSVAQFLNDYAAYRGRAVVSHRLLPSHERQMRMQAPRTPREPG